MKYRIKLRYKGTKEKYNLARGGSAEGSKILNFSTKKAAKSYARKLKSFDTKVSKK